MNNIFYFRKWLPSYKREWLAADLFSGANVWAILVPTAMAYSSLVGVSPLIILAAQTAGGAIGSMFAPAKVIVGCSTVELAGQEGPVLRAVMRYGVAIVVGISLATGAAIYVYGR